MSETFDWYAKFQIASLDDIDHLCDATDEFAAVTDVLARMELLVTALPRTDKQTFITKWGRRKEVSPKEFAVQGDDDRQNRELSGLKQLIEAKDEDATECNSTKAIKNSITKMNALGLTASPTLAPALQSISWFLTFKFRLSKPFLSKDERPFYIIENPVLKERVFSVPMVHSSTWKGNLRWTMMKVRLENKLDKTWHDRFASPDEFSNERFRQALLFGTEQGEKGEEDQITGFSKYLNALMCSEWPESNEADLQKHKEQLAYHFSPSDPVKAVHHRGRLHFYPTFFDKLGLQIINRHDPARGIGQMPITIECVSGSDESAKSATGTFSLLYFPFDLMGKEKETTETIQQRALEDLEAVVEGIKEMMHTYGFGAKKTDGFGVVSEVVLHTGKVNFCGKPWGFNNLNELKEKIESFSAKGEAPK